MKKLKVLLLFVPLIFSCKSKDTTNTNASDLQNAPANNTPVTQQPESTVAGAVHFDTLKKKDTMRKP